MGKIARNLPCPCGCHSATLWIEPCMHCTPKGCAGWRWGSLRLNVGSGQRKFGSGWTNCDVNPKWEPEVICDGASMPMFPDGSADIIVSHHVAEHASCGDACPMFRECRRILSDGGSLIICVPDMRALAQGWLQGRISTQIYMTNVYGAFMDSDADRHKFGYDAASLTKELLSCGFSRVKPFDWRTIPGADIARDWWILAVEAVK